MKVLRVFMLYVLTMGLAEAETPELRIPFAQALREIHAMVGDGFSNPKEIYPCSMKIVLEYGHLDFTLLVKPDNTVRTYKNFLGSLTGEVIKYEFRPGQNICYDSITSGGTPLGNTICFQKLGTGAWMVTIPRSGQSDGGCSQPLRN